MDEKIGCKKLCKSFSREKKNKSQILKLNKEKKEKKNESQFF